MSAIGTPQAPAAAVDNSGLAEYDHGFPSERDAMSRIMILLVPFVGGALAAFFLGRGFWLWSALVFFAGTAATAGVFQMAWRAVFGGPGDAAALKKSPDRVWEKTGFQMDYHGLLEPVETRYDDVVDMQFKIFVWTLVIACLCGAAFLLRMYFTGKG